MAIISKSQLSKIESGASKLNAEIPGNVLHFPAVNSADGIAGLTEDDVAEDFALRNLDKLRYDHIIGRWLVWDGSRWKINKTDIAFHYSRLLCREHRNGERAMASKKAAEGVERMARSDQRLAVTSEVWDQDPLLLGTPGGTVDLRTGELKNAVRNDYITKLVAVTPAAPGAPCPNFMKYLNEATDGHLDLQRFLMQFIGYCLSGLTTEQCLMFIYGPGGNGKTILQNVISEIMGDYAKTAGMETFAASKYSRHRTEIAMLDGARFVAVSETETGQAWSETRINQLTGGDLISANYMRQDLFTFRPQLKLMIIGNHKPKLESVNDAAKRRFNIVQFLHKPTTPDPNLSTKLRDEYPAILRWMIDGFLDWRANGLIRPDVVTSATKDYFEEQDLLGRWISEKCECGPDHKESSTSLYGSWTTFALDNGEAPGSSTAFGSRLPEYGFSKMKSGKTYYLGIKLKCVINVFPKA